MWQVTDSLQFHSNSSVYSKAPQYSSCPSDEDGLRGTPIRASYSLVTVRGHCWPVFLFGTNNSAYLMLSYYVAQGVQIASSCWKSCSLRSLELHHGKGIWKEEGSSEWLAQITCMSCKATRMILVFLPKHALVFSRSGKLREEIVFLSAEFSLDAPWHAQAVWQDIPPETTFPSLSPLLQLLCPMHRPSPIHCTGHWASCMLRKSTKEWRHHDCKQLWLPEPSCFSTKLVYHALPHSQPWKGCIGLGSMHRAE